MPRTGKAVRIDKYDLNLEKQSIYCHVMTLAFLSDSILELFDYDFDKKSLANICAFHDLSEVIIGDVPDFTPKELAGNTYLDRSMKKEMENKANRLIMENLPNDLKIDFENTISMLEDNETDEYIDIMNFFGMLDKMEPIISVWRYINFHKSQIEIERFLDAMTDFFTNPKVLKCSINKDFDILIGFLQNKENAREYYIKGDIVFEALDDNSHELLSRVIGRNELCFI
ncbi:MAG: HD domain-containing protein [Candidatus Gracilibacteria bacterium]|nr:HD domain-containing protein [Candidatus Gracilibacteria bacterium]